ncbi:MAG: methionine adenosyltransferase domain-containing protein, partial [Bacteroidales bacterium]|nr:methionine adenosyltransferase domain-containing protein [Bacteroidales bacterium]
QGACDQGMMFGYASTDTEEYMPLALSLSHRLLQTLADIRHGEPELMPYLRPDAKAQFTIEFTGHRTPVRVHTIVLSTQHDPFDTDDARMRARIEKDVREIVLPRLIATLPERTARLFDGSAILHVNPTGKFVIGGPAGDTGLTGRKIIVDTYGTRHAGASDAEIAQKVRELFDLRPAAIIRKFGLKNPIYEPTAAYGHMGRKPYVKDGIQYFGWELLDSVDRIREAFSL